MFMPSLFFRDNLIDNFFDSSDFFAPSAGKAIGTMHTDIKETDTGYEIDMNLPGFKKEDVSAELKDGYLTVNAATSSDNETKDEKGRYIRRERYSGSCSRSFYVGEAITQEDVKARFEDGVLRLVVPKVDALPQRDEKKLIAIAG